MSSIRKNWIGLLFFVFVFFARASFTSAADLSPYLDSQTIAVVRIDLKQTKSLNDYFEYSKKEVDRAIKEMFPQGDARAEEVRLEMKEKLTSPDAGANFPLLLTQIESIRKEVVEKGKAEELFLIIYKDALFGKQFPVLLAVPVPSGASQEQIDTIRMQYLKNAIPVTFVRHGFIVGIPLFTEMGFAKQRNVMAFARKKFESPSTESRPEFAAVLASQPDALIQLVVGRIAGFQKEFEKNLDALAGPALLRRPKEEREQYNQARKLVPEVFQRFNHYTFSYNHKKPEIRSVLQCTDAISAKYFLELDVVRKSASEENKKKNFDNLQLPTEAWETYLKFLDSIKTKQEKNEIVTVVDASAMELLKVIWYDIAKEAIQGLYDKTDEDEPESEDGEMQMTPEMQQQLQRQIEQMQQQ